MKFYNTPEIETLKFAIANDVICTSMDDAGERGDGVFKDDEVGIQ